MLAWLYVQSWRERLTAFGESELLDAFETASAAMDGNVDAKQVRNRGGHAIRRLREQHMLVRVDGGGVARAGQFALSRLGSGIAEFYVEEDVLTRENLTLLLHAAEQTLETTLSRAQAMQKSGAPQQWVRTVEAPLRVTVSDLVRGIERRQRGLDIQQEAFQREVAELLSADWFGAVERCQELLDTSSGTLRELHEVMLGHIHRLQAYLFDLRDVCSEAPAAVQVVIERLIDQVDRVAAWSQNRQAAWVEYYEHVHGYLRDVVRLDPSRALAQRLRDQLARHQERPVTLMVAASSSLVQLREVTPRDPPPPVRRPKANRERAPKSGEPKPDPIATVEQQVVELLERGVRELSDIVAALTKDLDPAQRFLRTGWIAQAFAKRVHPRQVRERQWVRVDPKLAIEELETADNTGS